MCRVKSCCGKRVIAMTSVFSWQNYEPLLCFILNSKVKLACCLRYLLTSYLHFNPLWWKGHPFLVLVLEGVVGLHRSSQFQLLWHQWFSHSHGLLETNWGFSIVFEVAPKYCILDSCIDYKFSSISSKGFLPTVVYIMAIWIKFSHSHPF